MWSWLRAVVAVAPLAIGLYLLFLAFMFSTQREWMGGAMFGAFAVAFFVLALQVRGSLPVVLYLRRFGDTRAKYRFAGWLERDLVNHFRFVALSDHATNIVPRQASEFVGCFFVAAGSAAVLLLGNQIRIEAAAELGIVLLLGVAYLADKLEAYSAIAFARHTSKVIRSTDDLAGLARRAARWQKFHPANHFPRRRIDTLEVAPNLWKEAVLLLAQHVDAILIDVSEAGAGLSWELSTLRALHRDRLVVVASQPMTSVSADPGINMSGSVDVDEGVVIKWSDNRAGQFKRDVRRALRRAAKVSRIKRNRARHGIQDAA